MSLLSRDLADNQDNSTSQGNRIASLEEKLRNAESDLATCSSKLHQTEASLLASENEAEEHRKRLDSLQQEVQEASDSHARASKLWMNERQLLIQVGLVTCLAMCVAPGWRTSPEWLLSQLPKCLVYFSERRSSLLVGAARVGQCAMSSDIA